VAESTIDFKDSGDFLEISISGSIDEDIHLDKIKVASGKPNHVHLDGVSLINSTGIRQWITWIKNFENEKWVFFGCPPVFVNQLNMIDSFIPKGSKVESFYIPYYSDETDEEKRLLMLRADWEKDPKHFPQQLDSEGNEMVLDVLPDKYFKFLSRY
jgi:hypothetical protein